MTNLLIELLKFLEKLVPAFLVNAHARVIKQKEKVLAELRLREYELNKMRVTDAIETEHEQMSAIDIIDNVISEQPDSDGQESAADEGDGG